MNKLFDQAFAEESDEAQAVVGFTLLDIDETDAVYAQVEELETAIEVAETTITSLESIALAIGESKEDGGLDSKTATAYGIAANVAVAPLGIAVQMPSNESFDEEGGRITATDFSVEAIKATIQKIWNAIKSFVTSWYGKIVQFFQAMLGGAAGLAKASKALAAAAKEKTGEVDDKDLEIPGGLFTALTLEGKKLAPDSAFSGMAKDLSKLKGDPLGAVMLSKYSASISVFDPKLPEDLSGALDLVAANGYTTETDFTDMLEKAGFSKYTGPKKTGSKKKSVTYAEGTEYYTSAAYPGNAVVQVAYRAEDGKITMAAVNVVDNNEKADPGKTEKVPALKQAEIITAANLAEELAQAIADSKVKVGQIEKLGKQLVKDGDKAAKIIIKMDGAEGVTKEDIERGKTMMNNISRIASVSMEPTSSLQRLGLQAAKAKYSYAKKSLGNIKEKK